MSIQLQFRYSALSGYFKHDEEPEGGPFEATTLPGFGLIDRQYDTDGELDSKHTTTHWERFMYFLDHLNKKAGGQTRYKLIFVIRHGEGFHNAKQAQVGSAKWEEKWALLDGDCVITWADARLTDKGKCQARKIKAALESDIQNMKIPMPGTCYTSPLARCLETTRIALSDLGWPSDQPFNPIIKEALRERLGRYTSNRRSTRSWIENNYAEFEVEPGFTEQDELWQANYLETAQEHEERTKKFLDDIFNSEKSSVISCTTHSGTIQALYTITGHRDVGVATGAIVPLLVVAELQ
ncbi:histidine phosphatase superfamily [Trichoderma velutinum]